ncbi:hypothetical protein FSARC_14068, partial [Fusarium sarcochroum]
MCYQLIELYSACRCPYFTHTIDRCAAFKRPGHSIQQRIILVGYTCSAHSTYGASYWASHSFYQRNVEKKPGNASEDQRSDIEDSASALSDISAPATNLTISNDAKQEATEKLFRDVLNEFHLRHLWPQIVRLCVRKNVAEKQIVRFLVRFSRDLQEDAITRFHNDTVKFVGASRLNIAERIVDCHAAELGHLDKPDHAVVSERLINEIEEKEEAETYEADYIYEHAYQFIFEGAPFQSFILSLKLFVPSHIAVERSLFGKSHMLTSLWRCVQAHFSTYWILVVTPNQARLSWSCRCGHKGYDDYLEKREGALEELQALLEDYKDMNLELVRNLASEDWAVTKKKTSLVSRLKASFSFARPEGSSGKLPTYDRSVTSSEFGEACHISSGIENSLSDPKHKFLLVCAPFMERAVKSHQPDVCKIHSDRDFFKALRHTYSACRRGYKWRWLRRVSSIDFVKFEVFLSELVNIQRCPSLPENQERIEYDFEQSDTDPPIGPNLLLHLFENPDHAENNAVCMHAKWRRAVTWRLGQPAFATQHIQSSTDQGWRLTASAVSAMSEITVAAASLNFHFSLVKIEAPLEFQVLGQVLSRGRRQEAEDGVLHTTARRLAALFEPLLNQTPELFKAYGKRSSEIMSSREVNPLGSKEEHGLFFEHVGADCTSIWAAATSGHSAVAMHLLACMLARIWESEEQHVRWRGLFNWNTDARKPRVRKRASAFPRHLCRSVSKRYRPDLTLTQNREADLAITGEWITLEEQRVIYSNPGYGFERLIWHGSPHASQDKTRSSTVAQFYDLLWGTPGDAAVFINSTEDKGDIMSKAISPKILDLWISALKSYSVRAEALQKVLKTGVETYKNYFMSLDALSMACEIFESMPGATIDPKVRWQPVKDSQWYRSHALSQGLLWKQLPEVNK